jgi:hypothetical protein
VEYTEHEWSFQELEDKLKIKLNMTNLAKSEGLYPEDAKR